MLKGKNTEGILSQEAHRLTSIKHPNIHNIEVLEDDEYFYLVSQRDLQARSLSNIIFRDNDDEIWFEKLMLGIHKKSTT